MYYKNNGIFKLKIKVLILNLLHKKPDCNDHKRLSIFVKKTHRNRSTQLINVLLNYATFKQTRKECNLEFILQKPDWNETKRL